MKKKCNIVLTVMVVVLSFCMSAMAQETTESKQVFDYSAEKMLCEIVPSGGLSAEATENMRILGAPNEDDWSIGPEDAPLTIVEYSDFQCPYCRNASMSLIAYQKKHPDDVRLIYRHFPLSFHEKAVIAATAVNAAGDQGMFFDAADFLFDKQTEWSSLPDLNAFGEWLINNFKKFSDLDFEKWFLAFTDNDRINEVEKIYDEVVATGIVGGTPTIYVNFEQVNNISDEFLNKKLEEAKAANYDFSSCPDVVIEEGVKYQAVLETEVGDIHVDLYSDTAPFAVNNFKFLAENGWYENNDILKKQDGFMLQSGDPTNTMYGYPGYYFTTEFDESHLFDGVGFIGMANSGRNKNGGQFFITYDFHEYYTNRIKEDSEKIDIDETKIDEYVDEKILKFSKAYTVFGKVIEEDLELLNELEQGMKINNIYVYAN